MYTLNEQSQKIISFFESSDYLSGSHMPVTLVDDSLTKIVINGKEVISFGNCNYLGLQQNESIKNGAKEAIDKYGMFYGSSRSFMYLKQMDEYEDLLKKMFGSPVLLAQQTTMAHFSALPVLLHGSHVAIMDMQAHASLQYMIQIPKANGVVVDHISHNSMSQLEEKIKRYSAKGAEKVWYLADGIYSMHGDGAPMQDLLVLLDKYDNFFLYIDDAHGMSWAGPNGCGYAWKYIPLGHPKIILAVSLGKGYGVGGGALVCPTEEVKNMIKLTGGGMIFCGPLTPPIMGAGMASAKVHLSSEIYLLQDKLKQNTEYFIKCAREYNLPMVDDAETPIFLMLGGDNDTVILCNQMLLERGYYVNNALYPAMPMHGGGTRISLTCNHSRQEILGLVKTYDEILQYLENKNLFNRDKAFNRVNKIKKRSGIIAA